MRLVRHLKLAVILGLGTAILGLHSTAMASECDFTFTNTEAMPCFAQFFQCQNLPGNPYTYEECRGALDGCSYGLCLTLHPFCTEECASQTGSGGSEV